MRKILSSQIFNVVFEMTLLQVISLFPIIVGYWHQSPFNSSSHMDNSILKLLVVAFYKKETTACN